VAPPPGDFEEHAAIEPARRKESETTRNPPFMGAI
jgi:hypothetical protein